ncbi:AEC family transporter [Salipiger mucosus]|uniref:Auxin Efflux Carrier n=1 Tax=Salipiger mucosus DSM 16094 TaxID=1123237 RepID=S9RWQ6_9RHOB|nr:AEC family transporter [Salipiger mucosus]EPX78439.1 Auxin Efflux Carrier [Salipiger mucosus DSM 16094]
MLAPLIQLLPIYLLILLGFGMIRSGLVSAEALPQLGRFTLIVCIPVLVFSAVSGSGDLTSFDWRFIGAYAGASGMVLWATQLTLRHLFKLRRGQSWVVALGGVVPNTIFLGYPVASVVFPEDAERLFAWIMTVENMILIPLAVTLADVVARQGGQPLGASLRSTAHSTFSNPTVLGLVAGLAFAATGWIMPGPLDKTLGMIIAAAPVLSLVLVGGNVARTPLTEVDVPVFFMAFVKLVMHPAAMFAVLSLVPGVGHDIAVVATLFAAMPMFSIWVIFAGRHAGERLASSALVVTTLLGAVTVGGLVLLISS